MSIMLKKELHVESNLVEIEVPVDFLGKDIEVIIREKDVKEEQQSLDEFFARFNYDLTHLDFNRDELHER